MIDARSCLIDSLFENQDDEETEEQPLVLDADGDEIDPRLLVLGIEKFKQPGRKFYRLIWLVGLEAWPCAEDETEFRRKAEAVAAGEVLAERYKPRAFSQLTR